MAGAAAFAALPGRQPGKKDTSPAAAYEYKPPEPSILFKHVLKPTYGAIVQLYPTWWTPNGITAFGIACTLTASVVVLSFCAQTTTVIAPSADGGARVTTQSADFKSVWNPVPLPASEWQAHQGSASGSFYALGVPASILIVAGILNLVYCLADNTDGMQARRLKLSSPVGEYLDHGLDCVTSLLSTAVLLATAGLPLRIAAVGTIVVAFVTGASHTLNFRQNVFIWGNAIVSVDEAMLGFGIIPILAGYMPWFRDVLFFETGWRVVDVLWIGFLLSQVGMFFDFLKVRRSLYRDRYVLAGAAMAGVFALAAHLHDGGASPDVAAQFTSAFNTAADAFPVLRKSVGLLPLGHGYAHSAADLEALGATRLPFAGALLASVRLVLALALSYPALFLIAFSCCASCLIHVPIVAKCMKSTTANDTPMVFAFVAAGVFCVWPLWGALLAVSLHQLQVMVNIGRIFAKARRDARKQQ